MFITVEVREEDASVKLLVEDVRDDAAEVKDDAAEVSVDVDAVNEDAA